MKISPLAFRYTILIFNRDIQRKSKKGATKLKKEQLHGRKRKIVPSCARLYVGSSTQSSSATIWTRSPEYVNKTSKLGPGPDRTWAEFPVISLPFHGLHNKVYTLFQCGLARYGEVRSKGSQHKDFILVLT